MAVSVKGVSGNAVARVPGFGAICTTAGRRRDPRGLGIRMLIEKYREIQYDLFHDKKLNEARLLYKCEYGGEREKVGSRGCLSGDGQTRTECTC